MKVMLKATVNFAIGGPYGVLKFLSVQIFLRRHALFFSNAQILDGHFQLAFFSNVYTSLNVNFNSCF